MCPWLNQTKDLFGRKDGETIGERGSCYRREEKVSTRLRKQRHIITSERFISMSAVETKFMIRIKGRTFTSSASDFRKPAGLSTCSMTSIEHTTSNRCDSCIRSSAEQCLYANEPFRGCVVDGANIGSTAAWTDAIAIFDSEASTPIVRAPDLARDYKPTYDALAHTYYNHTRT